ncbi:hypothetical protein OPT61_g9847 [Boeremia exigua]|uniref:Uncharacterized protein n=1 Tax=Boeremia exigua TaxID=749465 RepID=A0ACC2HSC1_9PLEO|nr:hypothetical protein OPT61_g9847 [Boeremia exigua]
MASQFHNTSTRPYQVQFSPITRRASSLASQNLAFGHLNLALGSDDGNSSNVIELWLHRCGGWRVDLDCIRKLCTSTWLCCKRRVVGGFDQPWSSGKPSMMTSVLIDLIDSPHRAWRGPGRAVLCATSDVGRVSDARQKRVAGACHSGSRRGWNCGTAVERHLQVDPAVTAEEAAREAFARLLAYSGVIWDNRCTIAAPTHSYMDREPSTVDAAHYDAQGAGRGISGGYRAWTAMWQTAGVKNSGRVDQLYRPQIEKQNVHKNVATYVKRCSSKVLDEKVQQLAEVAVQLDEEVLLADNLSQALGPGCVARDAGEAVGVDPLCRQERRYWGDVARCGRTGCGHGAVLVR